MDGNKKITGIVFAGIIVLALTACKVQPRGYVGLYVDNLVSVTDSTSPGETPLEMGDTAATHVNTTKVIEAGLPVSKQPAEQTFKTSSDSVYKQGVEKLLKAINDSVQLLRNQMTELQSQLKEIPDTSYTEKKIQEIQPLDSLLTEADFKQLIQVKDDTIAILRNQTNELKKSAVMKSDTVYITKETVKLIKGDSIQTDYVTNQLLQGKNDTISKLRNQAIELKRANALKADTVYITKEIVTQLKGGSLQADYETTRMLQTKNDTILALSKELTELRNSGIIKVDTVYVAREPVKSSVAESQQMDYLNQQLLRSKDEQIQSLQNQLNSLQNAAARTQQQQYTPREQPQAQPLSSQQPERVSLQMFQAQNDTIQFLKSQLRNLQQPPFKEAKELQTTNQLDSVKKTSEFFREIQDSLQLLKTRIQSLEEQTIPDTLALASQVEKDLHYIAKTDTTLIVAFYEMGGIRPRDEVSVLKQIKDLCNNKNVTSITLSGFTDSSGSEIINKEFTNKRLNYLSEKIIPWIEKEKIFFQNFGDVFASDTIVSDERRIEIRILTE